MQAGKKSPDFESTGDVAGIIKIIAATGSSLIRKAKYNVNLFVTAIID
jgi:hypothetical protein